MKQGKPDSDKESFFRPVIVLAAICLVASALLALTNSATAPIIKAAEEKRAQETRLALLPEATQFTEIECDIDRITGVYKDDGGSGYIITVDGTGYKGDLPVTVGIDSDGVITGISVDASGETAGVGAKTGSSDFTDRFKGLSGSADEVDVITGASVSSRGVKNAVNLALETYETVKEG